MSSIFNKTYLNDAQVAAAQQWLREGCEAYAYNNSHRMMWYQHNIGNGALIVSNGRRLTPEQVRELDQLRSCNCGSGIHVMSCSGHPTEGTTYCG